MVTMLVGTSDPPCQDREGAQDTEGEQGDFKCREKTECCRGERAVCLLALSLAAPQWPGRKTERSLKFVVCGDGPAVN